MADSTNHTDTTQVDDQPTSVYRTAAGPLYTPAHLARAPRHTRIEDAVAAMGTGVVVAEGRGIVAFHETHLPLMERLATTNR